MYEIYVIEPQLFLHKLLVVVLSESTRVTTTLGDHKQVTNGVRGLCANLITTKIK